MASRKLELFSIELDDLLATYQAGQTVSGAVRVHLKDSISLTGIYVHIQGKASVTLDTKTVSSESVTDEGSIKDSKVYFSKKFPFPITVALPLHLPSSVEGRFGHVRYTCSSNIARTFRFDPKCKTGFTVLELIDLNKLPDMIMSFSKSQTKTVESGSVVASVTLNKCGYVPGERIHIKADLLNDTSGTIIRTVATLISNFDCTAGSNMASEKRPVTRLSYGKIPPRSEVHWHNECLVIPSVPPTSSGAGCPLISVDYFIEFKVDLSPLNSDKLLITLPITVGSIPLRSDFRTFSPFPTTTNRSASTNLPSRRPQPSVAPALISPEILTEYPDLPPPSYEDCVYGAVSIREEDDDLTQGNLDYTPRYLYFNQ